MQDEANWDVEDLYGTFSVGDPIPDLEQPVPLPSAVGASSSSAAPLPEPASNPSAGEAAVVSNLGDPDATPDEWSPGADPVSLGPFFVVDEEGRILASQ